MIFTLAWRNLWRNRRRTFITAGSVVLAVVLSIFTRSLNEGVYEKMIENVVGFYSGYVQIHQNGYWEERTIDNSFEVMPAVSEAAISDDRVVDVVPRLESFLLASTDSSSQVIQIVGISPEEEHELTKLADKVLTGSYLEAGSEGIMLGEGLAKKLSLSVGDTVVLFGQGFRGSMASGLFPIVATLKFGSPELSDRIGYIDLEAAQTMFSAPSRLTAFALNLSSPGAEEAVADNVQQALSEDYEVMDWREMMPELVQAIESDRIGGYFTMFILYLIIGFGILGTALMMTKERQYEFGVLTALGMKRRHLSQVMVVEMIMMGLLGVLIGIALSLPLVVFFHFNPIVMTGEAAEGYASFGIDPILPTAIHPKIFINQALIVLLLTVVISIQPILKIFRIDPVKAMRV